MVQISVGRQIVLPQGIPSGGPGLEAETVAEVAGEGEGEIVGVTAAKT